MFSVLEIENHSLSFKQKKTKNKHKRHTQIAALNVAFLFVYFCIHLGTNCSALNEPANGALVCGPWTFGQTCSMQCEEGFDVPFELNPPFVCDTSGQWNLQPPIVPNCTGSGNLLL